MKTPATSAALLKSHAGEHLVLYDGLCGLCNRANALILRWDREKLFDFASLQSAAGASWLRRFQRRSDTLDTFYVVTNYRGDASALVSKSAAALFVARRLGAPWSWFGVMAALPRTWLDRGYESIARNRYRVFGRRETCEMPSGEHAGRFIDV